jgi:hypothetical protein
VADPRSPAADPVPDAPAAPASEAERLYPTSLREEESRLLAKRVAWWKLRLEDITKAIDASSRSGNQSDDVRKAEDARLVAERDSILAMQDRHHPTSKRLVGLALSGGGLRSATFSLGFLQALAREKVLRQVDFLSTVSGGSYIGAFLGALYHRRAANTPGTRDAEVELADRRSKVIDWLRENGRYLAPGGTADGWVALTVIFRNLATVNAVIWTGVLTVFLGLNILRGLVTGLLGWWGHALPLGGGTIWWSVSLLLPAATVPLCLVPLALAYWLVPDDPVNGTTDRGALRRVWRWLQRHVALVATAVFMASAITTLRLFAPLNGPPGRLGPGVVVLGAAVAVAVLAAAWLLASSVALGGQTTGTPPSLIARQRLTRWMRAWLIAAVMLFLAGLVDSLGQTLYRALIDQAFRDVLVPALAAGASSLMGVTVGAQKLLGVVGVKSAKVGVPVRILALGGALVLILPIVVALSAVSHGLAWDWACPTRVAAATAPPPCSGEPSSASKASPAFALEEPAVPVIGWPLAELALGLVLCAAFGRVHALLNGSSIATLYAARLNRAYVGASNPTRVDNARIASTELLADDSIRMADYAPYEAGGPLHIINTTLNETIGGRSQVQERDRKGMNLAFGPAGISVAARHHALWKMVVKDKRNRRSHLVSADRPDDAAPGEFRVFPVAKTEATAKSAAALEFHPELLDLGRWTAISAAAASTALGSMTSLGLSLLCGVLNVRLGHWWWSGVDPRLRGSRSRPGWLRRLALLFSRAFPVQGHLLDELIARFPGTGTRNWYLTDGGHFENTGVYELIRRRLPVILALDNGADPGSTLADVANLVRKARVDFDAEIQFLDRAALDDKKLFVDKPAPSCVGTLEDIGVKASAALARISYAKEGGDETGWLLLVKPAVIGKESVDVREYRAEHKDFPQQTTLDQFFDEAQWESYRKLGELIGTQLFADGQLSSALEILT